MQIRFNQARLSSTVLPLLEKFIINRAMLAVTIAVIVEINRIWLYTSCMISFAFVQMFVAANTGQAYTIDMAAQKHRTPGTCRTNLDSIFRRPVPTSFGFFFPFMQTSFSRAKKEEHPGAGNAPLFVLLQYDVIRALFMEHSFSISSIAYDDLRRNGRSLPISCHFCFRSTDGRIRRPPS